MRYRLNLVPEEYRGYRALNVDRVFLVLVFSLFFAGLVTVGVLYEKRFLSLQRSLKMLDFQKNNLLFEEGKAQKILERINKIQEVESRDKGIMKILDSLLNDRFLWSRVLAQTTYIVPEGAWLESMSSSGEGPSRRMKFRGTALDNQWVARFLFYLENHPDFSNVRLEYSRQTKIGSRELYTFEIETELNPSKGRR